MSYSPGLLRWRGCFRYRVVACVAVGLTCQSGFVPMATASTAATPGTDSAPPARSVAPVTGTSPMPAASAPVAGLTPKESLASASDSIPQLWTPRTAVVADASQPLGAESLFDGDATTGLTVAKGESVSVRLDLGSAREVLGLGVNGNGRAKITIYAQDAKGTRTPIRMTRDGAIDLGSDRWAQLAPASATKTSTLVVEWSASPTAPAAIAELALWVAGRARPALHEAAIADRLVTELPENADAATAVPWTASVARVTAQGPVSAKFDLTLNREPRLGRAFLVYELDKKAHWTGVARSINGHVVRGGYRAEAKGLGGVQVEEVNPAWLRQGANTITFQPTQLEDGRGYSIRNVRVISVPLGIDAAPATGARSALSDGDPSTGVGGPGAHAASLSNAAGREPAFLSFHLDKPARGTVTVSGEGGSARMRRSGRVNVDLDGRPAGWQTVPVGGVLPATSELRVRVVGDRENKPLVSEARIQPFPALASPADLTVSYPLHGECLDHKTYVRGFVSGADRLQTPQVFVDGKPTTGKVDADGSFEVDVDEPAAVRGKPWNIRLEVATEDGARRSRTVPVGICVDPPKRRVIGVSPPVEDAGAPYGAVVSPGKASTLSFAGAQIEIPAGAVDGDVRVTMRALDRGQLAPIKVEMENVSTGGGAMRFGPHGLKFKKPVKVTLPIDASRMPLGMTHGDVVGFFFDEASSKWTELPKVSGNANRIVARTTHFTDFIASTVRSPDHPDMQQFNPNTMNGVKSGEPAAGITMIEPPVANPSGSARLSYPIMTPPARNGIGPTLALMYDSERESSGGWLGIGWSLALSSIEIETRFGVPKYDATDIYSLDGAMLAPHATAGRYIRRVESSFDKIERLGTGPTDYRWRVTDKAGTVFTYGSGSNSRLANPRLTSPDNGKIFRWYLERVQDVFGNFMTITYVHDNHTKDAETLDEVYPSVIDYTGGPSLTANYHVEFRLDAGNVRPDIAITARPGFLVGTRRRLTDILVKSGTTVVRQYKFIYGTNMAETLQKSVLSAVALWGADNASTELYRHTFEYNKAPLTSAMFQPQLPWGAVARTEKGLSSTVDGVRGMETMAGFGFPGIGMAVGTFGTDSGSSTPEIAFLGVTGEGLPDQVDRGGTLSLNVLRNVPADAHFQASSVTGLPSSRTLGATGRSGWAAGGRISALDTFGVGVRYGRHMAVDSAMITDMNGDGFPDIVSVGGAGTLNAYVNDGKRNFALRQWSGFSLGNSEFTTANRVNQASAQATFNVDPLIRWVAPFGGTVTVSSTARLESDGSSDARVDVYAANTQLGSVTLTDATQRTVASVNRTVAAGDRIYVRVADTTTTPSSGAYVSTSIVYTPPAGRNVSELDPTGNLIFNFNEGLDNDDLMHGMPRIPWRLTANGDILAGRCFRKNPTPDDVLASIVIRNQNNVVVRRFDKLFAAATVSAPGSTVCFDNNVLAPSAADPTLGTITGVPADHNIGFEFTSDAPFDPNDIRLEEPDVGGQFRYTRYCRPRFLTSGEVCGAVTSIGNNLYTIPNDPWPSFPIRRSEIQPGPDTGDSSRPRPFYKTQVWRIFNNGTTTTPQPIRSVAAASASVTFAGSVTTTAALTEEVVVLIQGVNKLHKKVRIPSGTASGTMFPVTTSAIAVTSGEPVFFTIHSPTVIGGNVSWSPTMNGTTVSANNVNKAILDPTFDNNQRAGVTSRDPMSGGFHRWFYGDWNDSIPFNDSLIVRTSELPRNTDAVMAVVAMDNNDADEYHGRGGARFIDDGGATTLAITGRINDSIAMARGTSGINALRISDTWNLEVSGTVFNVTAGGNGGDATTQVDFFDLNGDGLPDSITRSGIQYNDGTRFGTRQTVDAGFGELRKTINASFQLGVAVDSGDRHVINLSDADAKTKLLASTAALSGSVDYGVSSTRIDFADVNGDGLEDHIMQDNTGELTVKLNLGYGFSNNVKWTGAGWNTGNTSVLVAGLAAATVGQLLNLIPNVEADSTDVVRLQDTATMSAGVGGSLSVVSGGGGPTWSTTRKWVDLIDVNGDGLPDQVMKVPGRDNMRVKLNKGDRFDAEQSWTLPTWIDPATPTNPIDQMAGLARFTLFTHDGLGFSSIEGWSKNLSASFCFILCVGLSGYSADSKGGPSADFEDIDGDGKVDHVLKVPGSSQVHAKLNRIGKTNLLSAVNRPLGSRFTIDYARSGNHVDLQASPKMSMPANQWVMSSVVLDSGNGQNWNAQTTQNFDYANATGWGSGYFDPVEREDFGFANVKTIFPTEDVGGTAIAVEYHNQNYYLRGLETQTAWIQNNTSGVRLRSTRNTYADPSGKTTDQLARTGTYFPAPTRTDTQFIEVGGGSQSNFHTVARTFNTNGDLTDVIDHGDQNSPTFNDDFNYHIDYQTPPPAPDITVPSAITVRSGTSASAGTLLAKRTITSFTAQGKPNGVTDAIVNGKSPDGTARTENAPANATWTFTYDVYGNVRRSTSPNGPAADNDGSARTLEYSYDTTTRTYPVTTTQIGGEAYTSSAVYDLKFGLPTRVIDVAGARQEFDYDAYGRVTKVFAPSDFNASGARIDTNAPTIGVSYSQVAQAADGPARPVPAWAMATHRSNAPPEGTTPEAPLTAFRTMRTVNFVDGLNRSIQVKKDITHQDTLATTSLGMSVSGKTTFDARGRVYQQGQPTFVRNPPTATAFETVGMSHPTQLAYDVLGRLRQEKHPDSGAQATTTISYQKGIKDNREWIVKITTDPLNAQDTNYHKRTEYRTGRDELRFVVEPNRIAGNLKNLQTSYAYDPLGRLVSATDAKNNVTTAEYDTVGNLVTLISPDAGRREWRYCRGGYVCAEQSANMLNAGANTRIEYRYDRDRLTSVIYPSAGNPGVSYVYGVATDTGATNGFKANRVTRRTDEAGQFDFTYDGLGNVASETALLKNTIAGGNYQSYATTYRWDNFGRLIDVTIPGTTALSTPTETIRYGYDAGGAVTSAWGRTGNTNHAYVRHVGYSEFGERMVITYGNQAYSQYSYATDTRRLNYTDTTIQPSGQSARLAQKLTYTHDLVGNVKNRDQDLPLETNATAIVPVGGISTQAYFYDPLNQLTSTDLYYAPRPSQDFFGNVNISYDDIGNIKQKFATDAGSGAFVGANNYTFTPAYAGNTFNTGPHRVSSNVEERPTGTSTRTVTYDRNGNALSLTTNGTGRRITWTDTDRIRSMCNGTESNCAPMTAALYAADGTRTHNKITVGGTTKETLYVNQFLTVRDGTLPTKHIYLGDARIASKVESNGSTSSTYWYHSDHLQSTQYVTTTGQALVQHLEYFPAGEIWREEANLNRPELGRATTFTGKETDASGYYYFGARSYDPQLQMWLSPDPILGSYMRGGPGGGVFQPKNLGLYTYSWNNPATLRDPNGLTPDREYDQASAWTQFVLGMPVVRGRSQSVSLLMMVNAAQNISPRTVEILAQQRTLTNNDGFLGVAGEFIAMEAIMKDHVEMPGIDITSPTLQGATSARRGFWDFAIEIPQCACPYERSDSNQIKGAIGPGTNGETGTIDLGQGRTRLNVEVTTGGWNQMEERATKVGDEQRLYDLTNTGVHQNIGSIAVDAKAYGNLSRYKQNKLKQLVGPNGVIIPVPNLSRDAGMLRKRIQNWL
jgi:RHS repeat-associated protein